jgi:hypothetical protein
MVELYIKQYDELFTYFKHDSNLNEIKRLEDEFTSFFMSRMLYILSSPEIKTLHAKSCKLIVLILETFNLNSKFDFYCLVTELIHTLDGKL